MNTHTYRSLNRKYVCVNIHINQKIKYTILKVGHNWSQKYICYLNLYLFKSSYDTQFYFVLFHNSMSVWRNTGRTPGKLWYLPMIVYWLCQCRRTRCNINFISCRTISGLSYVMASICISFTSLNHKRSICMSSQES